MPDERIERKLAAILAADVVGYSRLMGADEAGTRARFNAHLHDLIKPVIADRKGRVVKITGDGLLVEFGSVVDSVRCAIELQAGMAERNADESDDRRIDFRVGVNLGDVIIEGDDIHGDGVNIAARLEALADPGGICISGDAYRQCRGKIDVAFNDLGERRLKNIAEPVHAFAIRLDHESVAPPERRFADSLPLPDKPSIAVLPFENMSGDPEQEYFSDGITEDIITALSRLRWLFVIARNSTFSYKKQTIDIKTVGRQLGVRYVLAGSVRKSGQRIRVTAQLTESEIGSQIWAERYDRELADIFDLQDELTEAISAVVDAELAISERELARKKSPTDLDAWDCFQRGMWHLYKMSKNEVAEARRLFETATERAPSFPSPHAALGYVAAIEALSGYTSDRNATLAMGRAEAERAVALDERDGFGHFALGRVCILMGRHDPAILALERSIELNPNSAPAHYGLGVANFWVGRPEHAVRYLDRAIRLSPNDPQLWTFHYIRGNARCFLGEDADAIADQNAAIRNKGDEYLPYLSLAFVCSRSGEAAEEARAAFAEAQRLKPELSETFLRRTIGNLHRPYLEAYLRGLRALGLPEGGDRT